MMTISERLVSAADAKGQKRDELLVATGRGTERALIGAIRAAPREAKDRLLSGLADSQPVSHGARRAVARVLAAWPAGSDSRRAGRLALSLIENVRSDAQITAPVMFAFFVHGVPAGAVRHVLRALGSRSATVRLQAALAASRLRCRELPAELSNVALRDPDPEVRAYSALAVGAASFPLRQRVDLLREMLELDESPYVRGAALLELAATDELKRARAAVAAAVGRVDAYVLSDARAIADDRSTDGSVDVVADPSTETV